MLMNDIHGFAIFKKTELNVGLILSHPAFILSWIDSGVASEVACSTSLTVFLPEQIFERISHERFPFKVVPFTERSPLRASTYLRRLSWVRFRKRSSSFKFWLKRTFFGDILWWPAGLVGRERIPHLYQRLRYTAWAITKNKMTLLCFLPLFRFVMQPYLMSQLNQVNALPEGLDQSWDLLIVPTNNGEARNTEYLAHARRIGLPTLLAVDNWDNLTSKSVFVIQPDYVTVMGDQCIDHAVQIHEFERSSILPIGLPRFDAYRNNESSSHSTTKSDKIIRILYLGLSLPHAEDLVVDQIADFCERKYGTDQIEVKYRPHPLQVPRMRGIKIRNTRVHVTNYSGDKQFNRTGMPAMNSEYIDEMANASIIIGAPTTMILEAMLLNKACIVDLTDDLTHRTTAKRAAENYVHMRDLVGIEGLWIAKTVAEITEGIVHWISAEKSGLGKYNLDKFVNRDVNSYGKQLSKFIHSLGKSPR